MTHANHRAPFITYYTLLHAYYLMSAFSSSMPSQISYTHDYAALDRIRDNLISYVCESFEEYGR